MDRAADLLASRPTLDMAQLARALGVSRATLYRHVPSRAHLHATLQRRGAAVPTTEGPRERLFAAVEQVLLRDGFQALSVERLARESGTSLATLYRLFGDRTGLLRAFIASRPHRALARHLGTGPLDAELTRFATALLEAGRAEAALFRLALSTPPELAREVRGPLQAGQGTVGHLARFLHARMRRGELARMDPHVLALQFLSPLLLHAVFGQALHVDAGAAATLASHHVRTFLHGALA